MSVRRLSKTFISGAGAAAEKSSSFLAGYSPAIDEMDLIERITVGAGGTSAIEFDQIPQTYQHLQIRVISRCVTTGGRNLAMQFNSDTGTNYTHHAIYGDGAATAFGFTGQTYGYTGHVTLSSDTASTFAAAVVDVLDYASTSKTTVMRVLAGWDSNGSGYVFQASSLWNNTAAVTGIKLYAVAGNLAQYSTAALYGVKV